MIRGLKMATVGVLTVLGSLVGVPGAWAQDGVDGLHLVGYSYRE